MSKIDYIFLPTIQHTGTWFVIGILETMGFNFTSLTHDFPIDDLGKYEKDSILHVHYPLSKDVVKGEEYKFFSYPSMLISLNNVKDKEYFTVIPIRDVLAAVITRFNRHQALNHNYIINGFLFLARRIKDYYPFYFPIDLYFDYEKRIDLLLNLERYLNRSIVYKQTIANEWQQRNSTGIYNLKEAYYDNNVNFIKDSIPIEWEYLMQNRNELQPFFEQLGYKNLLWFKEKYNVNI